jgi:hypothetical protein
LSSKKFSLNEAESEASPSKARKCFNDLLVESFLESMEFGEVVLYFLELQVVNKEGGDSREAR